MAELPSGTVTFLMTDIEGSTKLLERLGDGPYERVLDDHRSVIRAAIARHNGHEVHTEGDALFAVFADATDALAAAITTARGLTEPVRVRIGLHTGEALVSGRDYVGVAVHRTARIRDAGHGGQILVSAATAAVVGETASLRDLGPHRLKDLGEPERLYQVGSEDSFPPLRTLNAIAHTLPLQRTTFVGQERSLEEVGKLLEAHRLVTLTGIGGCGKTRLALQVAADSTDHYPDGVFFVDLAPVSDPGLVAQAAVTGAGLTPAGTVDRPAETLLLEHLAQRRVLLVLDNCEHLLDAAAALVDAVLGACLNTTVLATSRELLEVTGEQAWGVPSLALPEAGRPIAESHAVRLFCDRAVAVQPDFELTPENETAVIEICTRLDGIPLAIELAAARVTHLSPRQIGDRLDDRFRLLTGARRRVQRQQTLQAAMDWSYDLLDDTERVLLRRLAVFAGAFPLDAVEGVCGAGDPRSAIVDGIGSLISKSLVTTESHGNVTWYRLLETVRAYAEGKLADAGESDHFRTAHRDWYLAFMMSPSIAEWHSPPMYLLLETQFEGHEDNVRVALEWTANEGRVDLIAKALLAIVRILTDPDESNRWIELVLATDAIDEDDRLAALSIGSWVAMVRLDPTMDDKAKRAVELADERPSRAYANALLQRALFVSTVGQATGDEALEAEATALANEAQRAAEAGGWPTWRVAALTALGQHLLIWERHGEAAEAFDAAMRIRERTPTPFPNSRLRNLPANGLALALHLAGEPARAVEIAQQNLPTVASGPMQIGWALGEVMTAVIAGSRDQARVALRMAVSDARLASIPLLNGEWLVGFAALAAEEGDLPRAARLLAAARALGTDAVVQFRSPISYAVYRHYVRIVRAGLAPEDGKRYRDEGRAMSPDEALAYALEEPVSSA